MPEDYNSLGNSYNLPSEMEILQLDSALVIEQKSPLHLKLLDISIRYKRDEKVMDKSDLGINLFAQAEKKNGKVIPVGDGCGIRFSLERKDVGSFVNNSYRERNKEFYLAGSCEGQHTITLFFTLGWLNKGAFKEFGTQLPGMADQSNVLQGFEEMTGISIDEIKSAIIKEFQVSEDIKMSEDTKATVEGTKGNVESIGGGTGVEF